MANYTPEQIEMARGYPIHRLLGVQNQGRRISMRCPFHNERTPSFCLYADGSYHCFGCGKNGGNAIDFIIDLGGTFNDAINELTN